MPYISQADRERMIIHGDEPNTAGELNYRITLLCLSYLTKKGKNYANINDVVGALECAKMEFYRRAAAPYEDIKKAVNGDIYP